MDPARLLRLHRACLLARDANVLRARAALGECRAGRSAVDGLIAGCRRAIDAVALVVLAPSCAACGELLERPTAGAVCIRCWQSVLPLTSPLCDACGDPLPTWRRISTAHQRCARCRRARRFVDRSRAVGEYGGALRAIVHALKYDSRRSVARHLGALMRQRGADVLDGCVCAVPVPLHGSRRRQRGFNQASDLARHVGLPVVHALKRVRATATQADLPSAQRHRNVKEAFAVTGPARHLVGATVVLVDDVCTTGATLESCARTLKAAGIQEVRALTAARVVSTRP